MSTLRSKGNRANLTPKQLLDHLIEVISSEKFLNKRGLGNEVPFFICPFQPEDLVEMGKIRAHLIKALHTKNVRVLEIDLYDISIELLQERKLLDRILQSEASMDKIKIKETLQGVLDPERYLIPAIANKADQAEFDVLFMSGVGEVFPYIRSHNVLNNLQSAIKDQPTVMFFPGSYQHELATGASLDLFGRLHDDKYYRAFNILHYEV
jgi:Domain of unknown function (DUF1788)